MARICHLTSVHAWHDGRIFEKQCRSLAAAGHDVHLVACRGSAHRLAGAATRDGVTNGVAAGVHVHLLDGRRMAGRAMRATMTAARVVAHASRLGADLWHVHDPELLPHALLHAGQARIVYDAHEDLALQVASKAWIPSLLRGAAASAVRHVAGPLLRRCDGVVAATPEVMAALDRLGLGNAAAVVIANAAPDGWVAARTTAISRRIAYVGALTPERGITDLVEAMADPQLSAVAEGLDLAGPASEPYLSTLAATPGYAMTRYHGVLDPDGVKAVLERAKVGVAPLHALPSYLTSRPTKIDEYTAMGLIVVASDFALWRRLYGGRYGIRFVQPGNPETLATALAEALLMPGSPHAGVADTPALPRWSAEAEKLVAFYEGLLRTPRALSRSRR